MDYQAPLAKAKGLGSAKSGTAHWWLQRVTAAVLIPLSYWLIVLLTMSLNEPYQRTVAWLAQPLNAIAIWVWVLAACHHAALGLQVVIEDYLGNAAAKIITVWAVNLLCLLAALATTIALATIALLHVVLAD